MSVLKSIQALRDKALEIIEEKKSIDYVFERDEELNLIVKWHDGESCRIPMIDFRPYQKDLREKKVVDNIKRFALEWPRRAGKEVVTWNLVLDSAITEPGLYIITYPTGVRAKKILWEGAALINDESIKFLNMIPKRLFMKKNDQEMTVHLTNGSLIWIVGCDIDPEKLRGTNARGVVFAEFAFSDPRTFYSMLPVVRQNNGWLICQSTYDGMNHFYHLIKTNENNPQWYCREESILTLLDEDGNPYITDADVEEDRRAGMAEYLIQQEYYGKVETNQDTKYFALALNKVYETKRIISNHYLPNKKVYAFYDIGVHDYTAITLAQFELKGQTLWANVIGYIENSNRDSTYYIQEVHNFCNRYNLIFYAHYLPHDGKNRNWNDGLKDSLDYFTEKGELAFLVNRPSTHRVAVETIRQKLYITVFNQENCQRLIDCLSHYGKEYDDKMGKFKDNPVHNWSSHGVKSYQTLALALDAQLISEINYDVIYYNN